MAKKCTCADGYAVCSCSHGRPEGRTDFQGSVKLEKNLLVGSPVATQSPSPRAEGGRGKADMGVFPEFGTKISNTKLDSIFNEGIFGVNR